MNLDIIKVHVIDEFFVLRYRFKRNGCKIWKQRFLVHANNPPIFRKRCFGDTNECHWDLVQNSHGLAHIKTRKMTFLAYRPCVPLWVLPYCVLICWSGDRFQSQITFRSVFLGAVFFLWIWKLEYVPVALLMLSWFITLAVNFRDL